MTTFSAPSPAPLHPRPVVSQCSVALLDTPRWWRWLRSVVTLLHSGEHLSYNDQDQAGPRHLLHHSHPHGHGLVQYLVGQPHCRLPADFLQTSCILHNSTCWVHVEKLTGRELLILIFLVISSSWYVRQKASKSKDGLDISALTAGIIPIHLACWDQWDLER